MGDKWGVTHCAICGRPKNTDEQVVEFEQRYDDLHLTREPTPEQRRTVDDWADTWCWVSDDDCANNFFANGPRTIAENMKELRERIDELEAQVQALKDEAEDEHYAQMERMEG